MPLELFDTLRAVDDGVSGNIYTFEDSSLKYFIYFYNKIYKYFFFGTDAT